MGLHRSTTCPSSDSDDSIINTLLHTLEDKAKARLSEASMGLHRSTTCPSSNSDDMLLNTLLHTLEDKAKDREMEQEFRHLQNKTKAIEMERADAARV